MTTLPNIMDEPALREIQRATPARERILLLGLIYLQAGLSPDDAYRSAVADYICGFDDAVLCAS